jgi:anaerobic magnesium-protoporphyrin IX monomethyl ester cyclase
MVKYLLINTPLTDPTTPYHSIPYLVGATTAAGFHDYFCLDANIESLNYLAEEEQVSSLISYCKNVLVALESKSILNNHEQLLYRFAIKSIGLESDSIIKAIAVMKDPKDFYNYGLYDQAVQVLKRWMDLLSVKGFPGQFSSFLLRMNFPLNLSRLKDITNNEAINRLMCPFLPYFNDLFAECIRNKSWDFIGLSVNYTSQLPFAIWMSKYIRSLSPSSIISVGGTEISDIFKQLRDPNLIWQVFPDCDVIMVGEGETALVKILQAIQRKEHLPGDHSGVLLRGDVVKSTKPVVYEDVPNLPETKYDIWNWSQYWSPEPVVLYSPTRGCYWNKCTFCDYGLNTDTPTSPSRERPVDKVVDELAVISKFSRTIYFAVDAMSPLYLKKLAKALIEKDVNIRWSAELRLERSLKRELAYDLKKAGCVCISFGYESGNQRILDLINKGVQLKEVPQILRQLSEANIGAQMMGFVGFPGETLAEALETFQFLKENRSYWTLAGIGEFGLTPGAIVAKQPSKFGIKKIGFHDQDDVIRSLYWSSENDNKTDDKIRNQKINDVINSLNFFKGDRPFVGGIDSSHSILYFAKFGKSLVPSIDNEVSRKLIEKRYYHTPCQSADEFTRISDLSSYHRKKFPGQSIGFSEISTWLEEYPEEQSLAGSNNVVLTIYPSGEFTKDSIEHHSVRKILQREKSLLANESTAILAGVQ